MSGKYVEMNGDLHLIGFWDDRRLQIARGWSDMNLGLDHGQAAYVRAAGMEGSQVL